MLYQLPNGKVIEISTEQYLELTDEELEYLIAYNYGEILENPWFGSVLNSRESSFQKEEVPDILPDLINIPDEDKINYSDIDYIPEEE
jgi:hypothetical protein